MSAAANLLKLRADLAAKTAEARRLYPEHSGMVAACELGFLQARAEHLAAELDKAQAALRPQPLHDRSVCASTFAGKPCTLEYGTYSDRDGKACIELFAVWVRGERFEFGCEEIVPAQFEIWERACETAEGWHNGDAFPDAEPPDWWANDEFAAAAAEDAFIAQRDHAHYARAAA